MGSFYTVVSVVSVFRNHKVTHRQAILNGGEVQDDVFLPKSCNSTIYKATKNALLSSFEATESTNNILRTFKES